ncbi:EamA family transporter, partial [bacterium]|nr:EamA family transporter [bacterium]
MSEKAKGISAILFAVCVWAGWMITTRKLAFSHLNPYDISALRFLIAGLVMTPVVWKRGFGVG